VRYPRGDEQEVAGLAHDRVRQPLAVACLDAAGNLVDRRLVAVVPVRVGDRAGRDDDEVHGESRRAAGLARDSDEVVELLPSCSDTNGVHVRQQ
jgi:hypothetical protein